MKYTHFLTVTFVLCMVVTLMTSCGSSKGTIIPQAVNTVNTVGFKELNLKRGDYEVMKTVTAEAVVVAKYRKTSITIESGDGEFMIRYELGKTGKWSPAKYRGVACLGYLSSDYLNNTMSSAVVPEEIARKMAIYRLVNEVDILGGDGIIEPVVSTNVSGNDRDDITYRTVAKGKVVRLKTDN